MAKFRKIKKGLSAQALLDVDTDNIILAQLEEE